MSLVANVVAQVGTLELRADLDVPAGTVCAVLGPNGSGKTSLLRVIAGLHPLLAGKVVCGEVVFEEPRERTYLPPEARETGFLFQTLNLIPTMSALGNVAFGLRARGLPRNSAEALARERLVSMGIEDIGDLKPAALSRGQAQRVAVARALVTQPKLLLLDEPFAALDASAADSLRAEMGTLFASFPGPVLLVTHDAADVAELADRTVTMEAGRMFSS